MKQFCVAILLLSFLLSSCATWRSVPDRLDSFVLNAESSAQNYSSEDWELSNTQYQNLVDTYWDNLDKYSQEDRARVTKAIAKYQTLLVLNGISETAELINLIKEVAPAYLDGIKDAVNDSRSGILNTIRELVDFSEIEDSFSNLKEDVGGFIEELVDGVNEAIESTQE